MKVSSQKDFMPPFFYFLCKFLLLFICFVWFQILTAEDKSGKEPSGISPFTVNELSKNVVQIYHNNSLCAGLVLDSTYIATAWHCVDSLRYIIIEHKDSTQWWKAVVVAKDATHDVAILKFQKRSHYEKPFHWEGIKNWKSLKVETKPGDSVIAVGHPNGKFYTFTKGEIILVDKTYIATSSQLHGGNSGGPLFKENGQVIGIASKRIELPGKRHLGDFVNFDKVVQLYQEYQRVDSSGDFEEISFTHADSDLDLDLKLGSSTTFNQKRNKFSVLSKLEISFYLWDRLKTSYGFGVFRPDKLSQTALGWRVEPLPGLLVTPQIVYQQFYLPGNRKVHEGALIGFDFRIFGLNFQWLYSPTQKPWDSQFYLSIF